MLSVLSPTFYVIGASCIGNYCDYLYGFLLALSLFFSLFLSFSFSLMFLQFRCLIPGNAISNLHVCDSGFASVCDTTFFTIIIILFYFIFLFFYFSHFFLDYFLFLRRSQKPKCYQKDMDFFLL